MKKSHSVILLSLSLLTLLLSQSLSASTVLQVDMDYVLGKSELVFEGEVISKRAQWTKDKSTIFSHVTFRVDDVIKGSVKGKQLTLKFAGGVVANEGVSISSMVYPDIGERGIYFVEKVDSDLVNPLVGWSQGHFLVTKNPSGDEIVLSEQGDPVMDVSFSNGAALTKATPAPQAKLSPAISAGVAKGLALGDKDRDKARALTKKGFKQKIRDRLKQQP